MSAPLGITRTDYTSGELRALSGRCSDGAQVRRMLALALVLEGRPRTEAAELNGICGATIKARHSVNQGETAPGWADEGRA